VPAVRLQNAARGFVSGWIYATLVVTLDRLFVSWHVKTWDNRVGDIANLSPTKKTDKYPADYIAQASLTLRNY